MAYEPTISARRARLGRGELLVPARPLRRLAAVPADPARPPTSDAFDDELLLGLMQMRWDKTEGSGVAGDGAGGHRDRRAAASSYSCRSHSATSRSPNFGRVLAGPHDGRADGRAERSSPWGLAAQDAPLPGGSALAIYDCGAPALPRTNTPPPKFACAAAGTDELHDLPAHVAAGRRQMADFYATGQIVNECAGACTCATGECD